MVAPLTSDDIARIIANRGKKQTATKTAPRKRKASVKSAPGPKKRRGRAKGSRNKNVRKDKGTKKGRKAKPGTKVGELRKTIARWKKANKVGATPKTQKAMMAFMDKHGIKIGGNYL